MGKWDADTEHEFPQRPPPPGSDSAARPLAAVPEPDLIARYQSGPPAEANQVLGELYARYAEQVLRLARYQVPTYEDAQSVAGQTWLEVRVKLSAYAWQGKPLIAWLRRIVAIAAKRLNAAQAHTAPFSGADPQATAERVPDPAPAAGRDLGHAPAAVPSARSALARFILQIRPRLKPSDRRLFYLAFFTELDAPRLAARLGKKPDAIRTAKVRLRRRISKLAVEQAFKLPAHWRILRKDS